jgi:GT2 family glycosyltransferase
MSEPAKQKDPESGDVPQQLAQLKGALDREVRRTEALERAIEDLENRLLAFDNSRFFRLLRWPGQFLNNWQGRLAQKLSFLPVQRFRGSRRDYVAWLAREQAGTFPSQWFRERSREWKDPPLISVIVPVYNPRREWLAATLDSLKAQSYEKWELCVCDDASTESWLSEYFERAGTDSRIQIVRLEQSVGIADAANRAGQLARGEYVAFLQQHDVLSPQTLYYVADVIRNHAPDILYTDEDRLDGRDHRCDPVFKPAWSPELLLHTMYIGHLLVVRRAILQQAGGLRAGFDGVHDYDLVLRLTDQPRQVRHIPRVLYHARTSAGPGTTSRARKLCMNVVLETVSRRQYDAIYTPGDGPNFSRLHRRFVAWPRVSVVICSRNPELLQRCRQLVLQRTTYEDYEFVIVEHGITSNSKGTKVPYHGTFNYARMNNQGAAAANGEILIFLNDDVEPLCPDWMKALVSHVHRAEIGVAGARLLYPSGAIQHAGLVIGIMNGIGHLGRHAFDAKYWPWLGYAREVSAVTGACLAIRKDVFHKIGRFDSLFPNNYNDADLCLRAREYGYRVIYEPAAVLRHHECQTRSAGVRYREREHLRDRWGEWLDRGDPFYNPGLSQTSEDASLNLEYCTHVQDNSR